TVSFVSASTSQGTINNFGPTVTASIGSLSPGAVATVTISFEAFTDGSITDTVQVACSQFEPDLANNTATDIAPVLDPVTITNSPASQTVPPGGTAFFSVGVSGTPPFSYQWAFNGTNIPGAVSSSFAVTNVTPADAGPYSVAVFQILGPEDIV